MIATESVPQSFEQLRELSRFPGVDPGKIAAAYRLNPLTEALLHRVLKVRQVNLINLILGRTLVPELLGADCTPQRLAAAAAELVRDERVRSAHHEGYDEVMRRLGSGNLSPSRNAADRILAIIAARQRGEPVRQTEE